MKDKSKEIKSMMAMPTVLILLLLGLVKNAAPQQLMGGKIVKIKAVAVCLVIGLVFVGSINVVNAEEATPKFLKLPFNDPDVKLQQGWTYDNGVDQKGIDYIKGTIDSSPTWETFDVLAVADGKAKYIPMTSKEGSSTWGNYVLTKHIIGADTYYTINAHLDSSSLKPDVWTDVLQGDKIGLVGITGASNDVLHLHFEFSKNGYGGDYRLDPYDLYSTKKNYPPYKPSGTNNYWAKDPYNADVYWLARIITSEASIGTREERIAVGWTVLNRLDSGKYGSTVEEVSNAYGTNQEPTSPVIMYLAKDLYERRIPADSTAGATHFFSPKSMPKEGEEDKCSPPIGTGKFDCAGGLFQIPGVLKTYKKVYFPSWTKPKFGVIDNFYQTTDNKQWVSGLIGVRNWYYMFYRPIKSGLYGSYYNNPIYRDNINAVAVPDAKRIDSKVDFIWHTGESKLPPGITNDGWWSADWAGYIYAPKEGVYKFKLNSNDGSWLFIDGIKVIDNGGDHPSQWMPGEIPLKKGYHSIWIKYFESFVGEANLNLYWISPETGKDEPVPTDALFVSAPEDLPSKIEVSKKAPANMNPGNVIVYTLYYTNFGSTPAINAVLEDKLPPVSEVDFISASDGGEYDADVGTVKWTIDSIGAFPQGIGSRSVTVKIKDNINTGKVIKNTVKINYGTASFTASAQTTITESDLPKNVIIEPITGNTGGTTSVFWKGPIIFSYYSSCANNVGINIKYSDGSSVTYSMKKTLDNMWSYTVPGFEPEHGKADVTYTIAGCDGIKTLPFSIYIDPAGFIYNIVTGQRIANATVWLQQPDNQGNWHNVPVGETPAIMQPDINPLITNQDGQYQWDVLNGTYRIHIEAQGYYPADSIAVNIPPPVTDLNVGLTHLPDNIPPITTINLTGIQGNNNWYISNVEINLTATDDEGGSGVKTTEYSFDNIAWNIYDIPFNITSESITMVYYRSIDYADNSETLKTQTISIDKTKPNISILGVTNNSYYNSNVTVYVNSTDTNLYNQSMTLNGYPYINGTNITEEGSYTLVATATDLAGNNVSKTINFVIDKTPPEAKISFNATTKNITVYDNDTKTEASYIILPTKKIKGNDDGERNEDNRGNESGWNLRQYALQDQANNSFVLILNYKSEGKEAKAEIVSLQYNNDTTITINHTSIEAEYSVDKNESIKELEQKIEVQKQFEIEAKYSFKKNQTEIRVKTKDQKEEKKTSPGLVILEILTDKGSLKYGY